MHSNEGGGMPPISSWQDDYLQQYPIPLHPSYEAGRRARFFADYVERLIASGELVTTVNDVVTATEAARMGGVTVQAVLRACRRAGDTWWCRKADKTWLLHRDYVLVRWLREKAPSE